MGGGHCGHTGAWFVSEALLRQVTASVYLSVPQRGHPTSRAPAPCPWGSLSDDRFRTAWALVLGSWALAALPALQTGRPFPGLPLGAQPGGEQACGEGRSVPSAAGAEGRQTLRLPAGLQACQLALSARTVWARCPNGDLARRYGVTDRNPAGDYWKKIPGHVTCFTGRCQGAGAPVDGVGGALAVGWGSGQGLGRCCSHRAGSPTREPIPGSHLPGATQHPDSARVSREEDGEPGRSLEGQGSRGAGRGVPGAPPLGSARADVEPGWGVTGVRLALVPAVTLSDELWAVGPAGSLLQRLTRTFSHSHGTPSSQATAPHPEDLDDEWEVI